MTARWLGNLVTTSSTAAPPLALPAKLTGGRYDENYRLQLRTIGIPTVLEVGIPIELITPAQKLNVAKIILSEWGELRTL